MPKRLLGVGARIVEEAQLELRASPVAVCGDERRVDPQRDVEMRDCGVEQALLREAAAAIVENPLVDLVDVVPDCRAWPDPVLLEGLQRPDERGGRVRPRM